MKKSLVYLIALFLLIFAAACSSDDGGPDEPTDGSSAEQYYKGGVGSTFSYEGETTDSNNITTAYNRSANFSSEQTVNNTTYIQQSNVITVGPSTTAGDFLFRRSSTGMFIYIDTSIFTELLDSLGVSSSDITINADQEIRMLSYPFDSTPEWDAFIVKVTAYGIISLDVLEVTGNYRGQENVTVMNQSMTAEKIEYIATIKIPESLEDIANPATVTLSANGWFVKDVGLVKLQGSGFLISVLGGSDLEVSDDNSTASEVLVSYNLQ